MANREAMQSGALEVALDLARTTLPREQVETAFRGYAGRSPNSTTFAAFLVSFGVAAVGLGLRNYLVMMFGVLLAVLLPAVLLSALGQARLVAVTRKQLVVLGTRGKVVEGEIARTRRDQLVIEPTRGKWRKVRVADETLWVPTRVFGPVVDELDVGAA